MTPQDHNILGRDIDASLSRKPRVFISHRRLDGLDAAERETNEERLVRQYHEAISSAGVSGYGWEQCWEDYRRYAAYGVIMLTTAAVVVERTERGDAMFLAMLRRIAAQVTHLDTASMLTPS